MTISESQTKAKQKVVRLNLQLPLEMKVALDQQAARLNTTTLELAREFLQRGLEALRRKEVDRQLIAGYQYLTKENQQLLEEFRYVDQEGWDEDDADN
ncbi:MAG: hypothetical protein ACE5PV_23335 [Candidatus Poribacteria bacterium]